MNSCPGRRANAPGAGTGASTPMHAEPNGGPPIALPDPDSVEYHAERLVLMELCIDPPAGGDELEDQPRVEAESAIRTARESDRKRV